MSFVPVVASVFSVFLALTIGALIVIRLFWPERSPVPVGRLSWADDDVAVRRPGRPGGTVVPAVRWRWTGLAAGAAGAVAALATGESWGAMVAWPVLGLGVLAGTLAGELSVPAPTGPVRRAGLRVRRLVDYLPRRLGALVAVSAAVLVALAAATTLGVSGGWILEDGHLVCEAGPVTFDGGPWPGAAYTVPGVTVVAAGLVLAGLVLRRVVRRPRADDAAEPDDVSRRRSAEVVTAAAGILVLTPLMGIAATAGLAMRSYVAGCGDPLGVLNGPLLTGVALAAFLAAAWCGGILLLPSAGPSGEKA
ncbi:hypothetical protein Asp14428_15450 [Actinoplanes sp. NBRC 14428]|nr:hypothetical protein Asp14428_15450 [Actinoplanes sp. NBRC 14428]